MSYLITYYSARVETHINEWPSDIKASYQHLLLLLQEHGADLRSLIAEA